jgi:hypothetical protein
MAIKTKRDYHKWLADPTLGLREQYGDIYRLDAFPWVDDVEERHEAVLEQRDAFDAPQGHVRRYWRVTGSKGLGRPSERGLYLALLLLTAEAEWESREIAFSLRALALRLNLEPGPRTYAWITDALDRLTCLHVHFQGTTEHPQKDTRAVTVSFFLVSSIARTEEDGEVAYTLNWSAEVFRALRSAMEAIQKNAPALSTEQLLPSHLTLKDPEQTRPGQERWQENSEE